MLLTRLTFFLLSGLMLLSGARLGATHIIGGEIYYDCLGPGRFLITLKVYRDCLNGEAPFDSPLLLSVFKANGQFVKIISMDYPGSAIVPPKSLNPCYLDDARVCVEEAVYTKEINLDYEPGGYILAYQRCCRNQSILNIYTPGDKGSTYTTVIPPEAWNTCNSSPRFNALPPIILCVNDPILFASDAKDPDGDSLVYAFCNLYDGGSSATPMPIPAEKPPYASIPFVAPYSAQFPVSSSPAIQIDSRTGLITGKPNLLGQYVMAVCVSEYRNGVLLGQTLRDFQLNVLMCTGESEARFDAPGAVLENGQNQCNGLVVHFENLSTGASTLLWDFGIPGSDEDQSHQTHPVFEYPDTGRYTVRLITNPGYSCGDTASLEIAVYHSLSFTLPEPPPLCLNQPASPFQVLGQIPQDALYEWNFDGPATPSNSALPQPTQVSWGDTGVFQVLLRVQTAHCRYSDSAQVRVYPPLQPAFGMQVENTCVPAELIISDSSLISPGALYHWDFGDGNSSSEASPRHQYTTPGLFTLTARIVNTTACRDSFYQSFPDYIHVKARPEARLMAKPTSAEITNPEIQFTDSSSGASQFWFYPGDGQILNHADTLYIYADTGNYHAYLVALNDEGCYDTSFASIRILPVSAVYLPNAFSPNEDGINDSFKPYGEGFRDYHFRIFNRWGEEVFSSHEPHQAWDGKENGIAAPGGVYVFHLKWTDPGQNRRSHAGKVILFR